MADKQLFFCDPSIWVKNSSYSETRGVGSTYESIFTNGSGNRIATGLIKVPAKTFTIWCNSGFQLSILGFDADQKYLGPNTKGKIQIWGEVPDGEHEYTVSDNCEYVAMILRRGSGSPALLPEDVAEAGLYWGGVEYMIIARDSITLASIRDVAATYRFYQLSATTPAQPTVKAIPPTGWSTTEPNYTEGETRDLYEVELTVFTDDTFDYSAVNKSLQYQAAKTAYSQSVTAITTANSAEAKANKLIIDNEIIVGTQTAATQVWTGNASFASLQDGQTILYWLPYAGVSGKYATLELTLADGETTTGPIPCYYAGTTRITTHYAAGSVLHLTYRAEAVIAGAAPIAGWWADANYTVTNTNNYDRIRYQWAIVAETAIAKQHMVVANPSTGKFNHLSTTAFDITKPILYAADAIAVNKTSTNTYIAIPGVPLATSKSGFTGTQYQTVYLVGTLTQNLFTPDEELFTTTMPTTDDGKIYIALGQMQTTTTCYLFPEHPMYRYYNGKFQTISQLAYEAYIELDNTREDLQTQITQNADSAASNASAIESIQITQTTFESDLDGIRGEVEGLATTVDGMNTRISTEMEQLADRFSFTFNTQSDLETFQKYIRFIDGKIYIGESDNELSLCIANNRISFMSGDSEVAYISQQKLFITDAEFLNSITLGNFAFVPRSSGNLSFLKVR